MIRPPLRTLAAALLLAAAARTAAAAPRSTGQVAAAVERSTGQAVTAVERSTGQVEVAIEPPPIVASQLLVFAAGAASAVFEGTISRRGAVEVVLQPVPAGMLDVGVAARSGKVWISIFRGDARQPEAGTGPRSRAVRWISSGAGAAKLRIVAASDGDETPFRVTVRAQPHAVGD